MTHLPTKGSPGDERDGGGQSSASVEEDGGGRSSSNVDNDPDREVTAAEFLRPVLLSLIENIHVTSRRVVASARRGTSSAMEDDEAVHDFRVALRRLRTLLRPARRVYGKKQLRSIAEDLRTFAQTTGALRDEEVLRETLTSLELPGEIRAAVDAWITRRVRQERTLRARIVDVLRDGRDRAPRRRPSRPPGEAEPAPDATPRLEPCLARLEKRISRRKAKRCGAEELGRQTIEDALGDVRAFATCEPSDGPALHALRIRFKRLRYSAETFAPVLGERAHHIAKSASRMQRRLGQLHDVDEAIVRIGRARSLSRAQRTAVLEALGAERARLTEKVKEELSHELTALGDPWPAA
jgi:CHAD domain-containing protein